MAPSSSLIGLVLTASLAAFTACHDEAPPRSAGEESGGTADTDINRTHAAVKTELQRAAEKTRQAGDSLQREIQHGARKGADELGVRRGATQSRSADAGT